MGFQEGQTKGKVKVLNNRTFEELNIEFNKLNIDSHTKILVECERCEEIFLRERRRLHQFHRCPTHTIRDELKYKWCNHCENYLLYSNFNINQTKADKLSSWCTKCNSFDSWLEQYLEIQVEKFNAQNIVCNLTIENLKELWAQQNGQCYYSKIKLTPNYGSWTSQSANLHRIDPINGYVMPNVVWCSSAMNNMKNNYSQDKSASFLQDIIFTNVRLECKLIHPDAKLPYRKRVTDAGWDLRSVINTVIMPGKVTNIETGLKVSPPEGWYLTIDGRSSLFKEGIVPFRGIIDSNYTGDLLISLYNSSNKPFEVNVGDRVAQVTIHQIHSVDFVQVKEFSPEYSLSRGDSGWGSSGRQ